MVQITKWGGKPLINGTSYSITGGKTKVAGTDYEIGFKLRFIVTGTPAQSGVQNYPYSRAVQIWINDDDYFTPAANSVIECEPGDTIRISNNMAASTPYGSGIVSGGISYNGQSVQTSTYVHGSTSYSNVYTFLATKGGTINCVALQPNGQFPVYITQ